MRVAGVRVRVRVSRTGDGRADMVQHNKKPRRAPPLTSVWDVDAVGSALGSAGIKSHPHLRKLLGWLVRHPEVQRWEDVGDSWSAAPELRNIPVTARTLLCEHFVVSSSRVEARDESSDGETTKLAVTLSDGLRVETVLMRYGKRTTACVSSQIGCAMGCTFCATGTMGIVGDLNAGEIVEQFLHARHVEFGRSGCNADGAPKAAKPARQSLVRNVVFMGMGEPLNNYKSVVSAVRLLIDPSLFGLGPRCVTVSTVGIVPRMKLSLIHI